MDNRAERAVNATLHDPLPVRGYKAESGSSINVVNLNKELEERVLRRLDDMKHLTGVDQRWLAIGRTAIEQGFMAVNRSVFQPGRVSLPEDAAADAANEANDQQG